MMNLCRKRNIAFFHIAKTAGVAVGEVLKLSPQALGWPSHHGKATPDDTIANFPIAHRTIEQEMALGNLPEPDKLFKFTIGRNPFDRLVSSYFFQKGSGETIFEKYNLKSFSDYIDFAIDMFNITASGLYYYDGYPLWTFIFQHKYAYHNSQQFVDFIGRFERIRKDIDVIQHLINPTIKASLNHKNATKHKKYVEYYTKSEVTKLRNVFAEDLELFGYDFK